MTTTHNGKHPLSIHYRCRERAGITWLGDNDTLSWLFTLGTTLAIMHVQELQRDEDTM